MHWPNSMTTHGDNWNGRGQKVDQDFRQHIPTNWKHYSRKLVSLTVVIVTKAYLSNTNLQGRRGKYSKTEAKHGSPTTCSSPPPFCC